MAGKSNGSKNDKQKITVSYLSISNKGFRGKVPKNAKIKKKLLNTPQTSR